VQFARLRMQDQGLVNPDAPRGICEITDERRESMRQHPTATAAYAGKDDSTDDR
jgi:hypothetical protein